jgi:hypothetical protein
MDGWKLYRGNLSTTDFPSVTAYFDESGHSASTRVVAIAGAMSTPKRWGALREKWTATLAKYKIDMFHMTDFESRQGEFSGWDENRKRALLSELFEAIENFPLMLMGTAIVVGHFNKLDANKQKYLMDPWYVCYQSCFTEALSTLYIFNPVEEGVEPEFANIRSCFFESHRQYKYGPALFALTHEQVSSRAVSRTRGVIGWGSKQSCVHFQLADLVAYELRKHVENSLFGLGRPTRWPMKRFMKMMFTINIFDDSDVTIEHDEEDLATFRKGSLLEAGKDGKVTLTALMPKNE